MMWDLGEKKQRKLWVLGGLPADVTSHRSWQAIQVRTLSAMLPNYWKWSFCSVKVVVLTRSVSWSETMRSRVPEMEVTSFSEVFMVGMTSHVLIGVARLCHCSWLLRWSVWRGRWRPVSWGLCACRWPSLHFITAPRCSSTRWRIYAFLTILSLSLTTS